MVRARRSCKAFDAGTEEGLLGVVSGGVGSSEGLIEVELCPEALLISRSASSALKVGRIRRLPRRRFSFGESDAMVRMGVAVP